MKKLAILAVLVLFFQNIQLKAQQDMAFSQYMFNMLMVNPAYAGSRDVISMTSLYRKQWVNLPGTPSILTFSADAPIAAEKMGLGLQVFNDRVGQFTTTGIFTSGAYRLRLKKGTMAMGLQAGIYQFQADLSGVQLSRDATYDQAFAANVRKTLPNFGTGIYYNTDKFYIGASLPHLVNNSLFKKTDTIVSKARLSRHIFLIGGYVIPLSLDVKLKTSTLIKFVQGAPLQVDLNTNLWFFDKLALGTSYRTSGALVGMIEIQATPQIRIGYAYDGNLGKSRTHLRGSHEFMLRYEFGYIKTKMLSPRYF
ncbi:MAG: type IX secretion system membrane protein PorP/SprF [Cytophagaceae bacterium]|jgi:type IX secretion system PorP/SprF family membrane protein|nr:type IX secretion system membrane protein PorP/SprF [Cytophagaceae bacterium]